MAKDWQQEQKGSAYAKQRLICLGSLLNLQAKVPRIVIATG